MNQIRLGIAVALLVVSLSMLFISCSPWEKGASLANKGILPLSTNNPYVAANLFIARECEQSTILYNFLKRRGGPTAMELVENQSVYSRMLLFYAQEREVYAAEPSFFADKKEWVIRGPFPLERGDNHTIINLGASSLGEPVFYLWGKEARFRFDKSDQPKIVLNIELPPPTPAPTAVPRPKKRTGPVVKVTPEPTIPAGPMNLDQQALQMDTPVVGTDAKGNVIHTVKGSETFGAISSWYTGDSANASVIAQFNKLDPLIPPQAGQKISIPKELVKNSKPMVQ